jgi:pimeloyl-ACP methyl ester carboxylesterase
MGSPRVSGTGQGEPVVFVHGSVSDLRTWERQLPALGSSYLAVAYAITRARTRTIEDAVSRMRQFSCDGSAG